MSMVSNLPAVPDDGYSDYIIYKHENGDYYLTCFDSLYSNTLQDDGDVDYGPYIFYKLNGDNWNYSGGYLGSHALYNDAFPPASQLDIVFSTVNIYNPDDTVCFYGSSYYGGAVPLISGILSTSDFFSVFGNVFDVLPIIVVAAVSLFAFRKSWNFLRSLIKGA